MYDKDDSGSIELAEMTDIIGTLYDMEGVTSSGGEGNISEFRKTTFFQSSYNFIISQMVYCVIIIKLLFKTSARASRIFSELDINGDGELSCDEFIRGCMQVHKYVSWSNYGVYNYTNKMTVFDFNVNYGILILKYRIKT